MPTDGPFDKKEPEKKERKEPDRPFPGITEPLPDDIVCRQPIGDMPMDSGRAPDIH